MAKGTHPQEAAIGATDSAGIPARPPTSRARRGFLILVALAALLYLAIFVGFGFLAWRHFEPGQRGPFGDMFGAFNAFVSGIAMLGVVVAILLQRKQIEMQAAELALQRREMELSRDELRLQREEIALNRRELERSAKAQEEHLTAVRVASHAQVLARAFDILQEDRVRVARGVVLGSLATKPDFSGWTPEETKAAETVCYTYDGIGIMVRHRMLPAHYIVDSWRSSLKRCWAVVEPLINTYRQDRPAPELWGDFERLAREASKATGSGAV